ncbi:hypothetical protein, partial [Okeania sp. SIO2G5]|uniref:hypothetical protein n=1 Tax=Okeania sp. SIO2G5 TaxID=2607796 RepID=UPI00257C919A
MNDANAPLNNLDFPNVMSPDAVQRQVSYSQQSASPSSIDGANVDALVTLVQDLNQQNHELLNRITVLEGELATYSSEVQKNSRYSGDDTSSPSTEGQADTSNVSSSSPSSSPDMLST